MTDYFLGVDIGGTKSHALIADENGRVVGWGQAGCGSWESLGWEGAQSVLQTITQEALTTAQLNRHQIKGAGFGYAGYDWPEDEAPHHQLIQSLGLTCPYVLGNDTLVGLVAGAAAGWGVVIVAGTSNNCRGRDAAGREARVTGMGPRFAEYGGGHEMVAKAVQAVSLAWAMRGPQTQLSDALVAATDATDVTDLLAGLSRGRYQLSAAQAPVIFAAAAAGDVVATDIIRWAGHELGTLALGIIRQLHFESISFEVVLSGSLYKGSPLLAEGIAHTIHPTAPQARLVYLQTAPVVGGVLLGMELQELDTAVLRPTLAHQVQDIAAKS